MTVNLTSKINAKLNEMARDIARDQRLGASIVDVQAKVIQTETEPDIFTVRTVVKLDSSDLDLEFNGGGKLLPQGGYTVTVDLPYRYKTRDGDNFFDVAEQGYDRLKAQLKAAFRAVAYNPEGDAETFPPPGTTITRHLLAGFKGNHALENLGIDGEAISQYAVQHRFGEHSRIQLSVSENRLKKIGGRPHFAIFEARHSGAGRKAADDNLATWILAVEADDFNQRREIMGGLLGAEGTEGAAFHATSRNDDAVDLSAGFGKTFGSRHVRLQMVAQFGELIKNCRTIKRSLQLSPDGGSATFTYDALDGRLFSPPCWTSTPA